MKRKVTWLKDSSSNTKRDSSVLSGLTHQTDNLVMRRIYDGYVVDSNNFVATEKSAVDIGSATRYYVTNRYLERKQFNS